MLGNAKGVFAAAVSVAVFHNVVTPLGAVGYAITLAGVALYTRAKRAAITAAASSYGGGRVVEVLKGQQGSLALTVDSTPLLMDHETARPRTSPRPSGTGSKY